MNRAELVSVFREKAAEIAEKDFSNLDEGSRIADLGMDSLGLLELVGEMERQLNVKISDDELVDIQTVSQLVDLMQEKTQ